MRHVFISYVRDNAPEVDRLCAELEAEGVTTWIDRRSIAPGARWRDAIRKAIRSGDYFIACFSSEYHARDKTYMNAELALAVEELQQVPTNRIWFIPVLISKCEVPDRGIGGGETLRDLNYVELYTDWLGGVRRIVSLIVGPKAERSMKTHLKSVSGVGTVSRGASGGTSLRVPFRVEIYQNLVGRDRSPGLYDLKGWVQIDDDFERFTLVGVPLVLEIDGGGGTLDFFIAGVGVGRSAGSRCDVVFKGDVSEFLIANGCPI